MNTHDYYASPCNFDQRHATTNYTIQAFVDAGIFSAEEAVMITARMAEFPDWTIELQTEFIIALCESVTMPNGHAGDFEKVWEALPKPDVYADDALCAMSAGDASFVFALLLLTKPHQKLHDAPPMPVDDELPTDRRFQVERYDHFRKVSHILNDTVRHYLDNLLYPEGWARATPTPDREVVNCGDDEEGEMPTPAIFRD